jgi:hypothetical protein
LDDDPHQDIFRVCSTQFRLYHDAADRTGRTTGAEGTLLLSLVFSDFTPGHHASSTAFAVSATAYDVPEEESKVNTAWVPGSL